MNFDILVIEAEKLVFNTVRVHVRHIITFLFDLVFHLHQSLIHLPFLKLFNHLDILFLEWLVSEVTQLGYVARKI